MSQRRIHAPRPYAQPKGNDPYCNCAYPYLLRRFGCPPHGKRRS